MTAFEDAKKKMVCDDGTMFDKKGHSGALGYKSFSK